MPDSDRKTTLSNILTKSRSSIEVVVAIVAGLIYLDHEIDNRILTKYEFDVAATEIRIALVESDIRSYQKDGIANLSDADKHLYDLLLKQQEKLHEKRDTLLGL